MKLKTEKIIKENKSQSFSKINKTDKLLARLIKKKGRRYKLPVSVMKTITHF